jgi:tetratricopeptide (TPR) repeat protein
LKQARALVDAAVEKNAGGAEQNPSDVQQEAQTTYTDVYFNSVDFASRNPAVAGKDAAMNLAKHWLEVRPEDQTARLAMAALLDKENDPAKRQQAVALLEQPITDPGGTGMGVARSRKSLELNTKLQLINFLIEQWTLTSDASAKAAIRLKIDEAFNQFAKITGPTNYSAKKLEGRIELQTGGANGAVAAVPILMQAETIRQQTGTQDLDLDWLLAQAYEKAGQTGKAEERLAKIVKQLRTFLPARILYAQLLLKDGNLEEADKQIIELEKQAPDNPQVKDLQIQRLLRSARPEDRARIPGLVEPYEKRDMTKGQALAIANALWAAGEKDHAIATLESVRHDVPGDYDIVQRLAWMYLSKNQKDLAQKVVEDALAAAPDDAKFKLLKLSIDGASPEMIRAAQREALEQIKDPLTRELRLFDFELTLGNATAAIGHLENAENISPDDKNVLELRFRVSIQLKQWDRAQAAVKKLAALNADEAHGRIYQFRLAMARGEMDKAIAVSRQLVNDMPTFARPHLCLAQALQASNQFEEAIKEYSSALEAQSGFEAMLGMISCYYQLKKPAEALSCIKRGLQLGLNDANFAQQMIRAYLNYDPDPKAEVVVALRGAGADLNAKDSDGVTPLMGAAQYNSNPDVVTALLKAGVDVNAKDKQGKTPLMHAVLNPNPDAVAALLKGGADVNAKDNSGKTALDYARETNNSEAVAALIKAGVQGK